LLEEVGLWSRLEAAIERWSGVRRRNEGEELALLEATLVRELTGAG